MTSIHVGEREYPTHKHLKSPSLGNFPLFPYAACAGDDINGCTFPITTRAIPRINGSIVATPGYFSVNLSSGIQGEMTVTNHTALYRFTFPSQPIGIEAPLSPLILVDLIDLPLSRTNGSVSVDPATGRITGNGTFSPSFGVGSYNLNFCTDFSGATIRDTGVFQNNRAGVEPKNLTVYPDGNNISPEILPAGAWVRFHKPITNNQILARVGLSFISVDQACTNAVDEIPKYDFEGHKAGAENAWVEKLGVIEITPGGANDTLQTIFWSGVYRSMISPQDYTDENPLWTSGEPYYDSYYCIWDSFRSIHPLITLLDQESQSRMVRSLIDIYRHEGKLPDCRMSLCKGFTQGGSNADIVLTDSYLKNITGPDWATAYEAMVSDAEDEPPIWSIEGRGGLQSWKSLHYIPTDDYDPYGVGPFTRSISRTVEYAYNDFCIAQVAKSLGHESDYEKYLERSSYWRNMFKEDQTSFLNETDTGFTGFLMPKYLNGTWGFQDPAFCSPLYNFTSCYLNPDGHETYEGSSWLYSFFAPGDMSTLVSTLGGPQTFIRRLDYLHESGLLYIGDEQAFLNVFLYHYAGRPGLSANRSHSYIPSQFNTTLVGIPGNDDSGAMGSFVALSMMGLFPNPGQDVYVSGRFFMQSQLSLRADWVYSYLITPPYFEQIAITNKQTGQTASIKNINYDPSYEAIWIQSATLNGQPYSKNWIDHGFFLNGGTLELTLGRNESSWGTSDEDLPPSINGAGIYM